MPRSRVLGRLSRSPHTRKARAATANKLAKLRGSERGAVERNASFGAAVSVADDFAKINKKKPKGEPNV